MPLRNATHPAPHSSHTPTLEIDLFGQLRLRTGEREIPPLPTEKGRSLFAYLAYHGEQSHPRGKLASLLWPELPEQTARRRLSQELWRIRKHLTQETGHPFALTGPKVRLDPHAAWTVDVHRFQEETAQDDDPHALAQAVARYTGDLLANLDDEWILPLREQLHQRYVAALTRLVELEKQAGHWDQALDYALRLVQADPLMEMGHRQLMQIYAHLGRPHQALAQYDQLRTLLREELDTVPTPATVQLAERIQAESRIQARRLRAPFLDDPKGLPLVGRDQERARLVHAVEWALNGAGGVALMEGEAGLGKSKLLDALAEDAAWRGAWIYRAAPSSVDEGPLSLLRQGLETFLTPLRIQELALMMRPPWLSVLADYFPAIRETLQDLPEAPSLEEEEIARQRAGEALLQLLQTAARFSPLILLLDDVHRADLESLETLRLLARGLRNSPALVVAAYRGEAMRADPGRWEVLRQVDQAGVRLRLALSPLDVEATGELIRLALGMKQAPLLFTARLHEQTGGNPFFVLESLRTLYENGLLHRDEQGQWATPWDDQTFDYEEIVLPEQVETLLEQRMAALSWEARTLLQLAAVLGEEFSLPLLQALAPFSAPFTVRAVRELVNQGFLVETPTHLRFHHHLMREVVYQNMPISKAREWHRQAGEALAEQGQASHTLLAHHFTLAQEWSRALFHHRQAGEEALARSDFRRVRHHFEKALEALDHLPGERRAERVELLLHHERAVNILGDPQAQERDLALLAELTAEDPQRACQVLCRRASFYSVQSRFTEARQAGERALALAQELGDVDARMEALTILARIESDLGVPARAVEILKKAVALETEDRIRHADTLLALTNALSSIERYPQAREAAFTALQHFQELGYKLGQVNALNVLGIIAMEEGRYEQAAEHYRQSIALSQEIGYRYGEIRARMNLANVFNKTGQLSRSIQLYEEVLTLCPGLGADRLEIVTRLNLASTLVAFIGDTARTRELLDGVLDYTHRVKDPATLGHALTILAMAELTDEEWEAAERHMELAEEALEEAGERFILAQFHRSRSLIYALQGQWEKALNELETGLALCREHNMNALESWILSMVGWVRALQGMATEAVELTDAAMALLDDQEEMDYMMWYHRAVALEAAGRKREAREALARSVERLETMLATLSPEHQAMSRERVSEHRIILAAWAAHSPEQRTVTLPGRNDPAARTVQWTVRAPEDADIPDELARRRHRLRRLLDEAAQQDARPTVRALAEVLGVSPRTVRRDLRALEIPELS